MSGPLDFGDQPEREPPAAPRPEGPPRPRSPGVSRSTWFVGAVALVLVVLVTMNAVGGQDAAVDQGGPERGGELLAFAAPLANARGRDDDDANMHQQKACGVRGAGILNICEELEGGPVVLALFPTEAARCAAVLDQFDRLAPRLPGVRLVAVGSRGDRAELRGAHAFPVGWDRDGGLATAYGLVGCPQISFAHRGGKVVETTRRELTDAELVRRARQLLP